jgi:hypothetical protein
MLTHNTTIDTFVIALTEEICTLRCAKDSMSLAVQFEDIEKLEDGVNLMTGVVRRLVMLRDELESSGGGDYHIGRPVTSLRHLNFCPGAL